MATTAAGHAVPAARSRQIQALRERAIDLQQRLIERAARAEGGVDSIQRCDLVLQRRDLWVQSCTRQTERVEPGGERAAIDAILVAFGKRQRKNLRIIRLDTIIGVTDTTTK